MGSAGDTGAAWGDDLRVRLVTYEPARIVRDGAPTVVPGWAPTEREASWPELVAALTHHRVAAGKAEVRSWSPVVLRADEHGRKRRLKGLVEAVTCLVLDLDDPGQDLEAEASRWSGWRRVLHSTWSHTDEAPKGRLVLPLWSPCPVDLWPAVFAFARERMEGRLDEACKDPGRVYYLPAVPSVDAPRRARSWGGRWLTIDYRAARELLEHEARRKPPAPPPPTRYDTDALGADAGWRATRDRLRVDRGARERAAAALGGTVRGDRAKGAICPQCGRASVWWALDPIRWGGAACDHRQSCGWAGDLIALLQSWESA